LFPAPPPFPSLLPLFSIGQTTATKINLFKNARRPNARGRSLLDKRDNFQKIKQGVAGPNRRYKPPSKSEKVLKFSRKVA